VGRVSTWCGLRDGVDGERDADKIVATFFLQWIDRVDEGQLVVYGTRHPFGPPRIGSLLVPRECRIIRHDPVRLNLTSPFCIPYRPS
jgi:hypothetical protein